MSRGLAPISELIPLATASVLARPETAESPTEPVETTCPQPGCRRYQHARGKHWFNRPRVAQVDETSLNAILRAMPAGSMWAPNRTVFMDAVLDATAGERSDWRTTVAEALWEFALQAQWGSGRPTTAPGHDVVAKRTGRSVKTVQRAVKWAMEAGLLGRVAKGRSARFRPDGAQANERAVYLLCVPRAASASCAKQCKVAESHSTAHVDKPVDKSVHPIEGTSFERNSYAQRARETRPLVGRERQHRQLIEAIGPDWAPRTHIGRAGRRWQHMIRAERIANRVVGLRGASIRALAATLRPFIDPPESGGLGWTDRQILHALDWTPEGTPWRRYPIDRAAVPVQAVGSRLRTWQASHGRRVVSRGNTAK